MFHATPAKDKQKSLDVDGAYINCWIEAVDSNVAETIAKVKIEELQWKILKLEEAYEISDKDYEDKSEGFDYYQQALIDKEVYVIHTYPAENNLEIIE